MNSPFVETQLRKLESLLSPERTQTTLTPSEVEVPAADLGASASVGYVSAPPVVHISIYVFEDSGKREAAIEKLKAVRADNPLIYQRSASNGAMLFFAYTNISENDNAGEFQLDTIMSAFAGDE